MEAFALKIINISIRFLLTLGDNVPARHFSTAGVIHVIAGHTCMALFQAGAYRKP